MITVVTFCWQGWRKGYSADHVRNLRTMLDKHLTVPHEFVCVTDQPETMPDIRTESMWAGPCQLSGTLSQAASVLDCYPRLRLYESWMKRIGTKLLMIDLDVTIRANIDDLITEDPMKFLMRKNGPRLQGGLQLITPGYDPRPWQWAVDKTRFLESREKFPMGSDQSILSLLYFADVKAGKIPVWTEDDGLYINDAKRGWRMLFRAGHMKPWDNVEERDMYFAESGHLVTPPVVKNRRARLRARSGR